MGRSRTAVAQNYLDNLDAFEEKQETLQLMKDMDFFLFINASDPCPDPPKKSELPRTKHKWARIRAFGKENLHRLGVNANAKEGTNTSVLTDDADVGDQYQALGMEVEFVKPSEKDYKTLVSRIKESVQDSHGGTGELFLYLH